MNPQYNILIPVCDVYIHFCTAILLSIAGAISYPHTTIIRQQKLSRSVFDTCKFKIVCIMLQN